MSIHLSLPLHFSDWQLHGERQSLRDTERLWRDSWIFCQGYLDITGCQPLQDFSLGWSDPVRRFLSGISVCLGTSISELSQGQGARVTLLSIQTFTESPCISQLLLCNKQPHSPPCCTPTRVSCTSGQLEWVDLGWAKLGQSALSFRSVLGTSGLTRASSFISAREHAQGCGPI